jgi:signal transduction histidine kinase/ActR/RegA family two-component response regulator
MHAERVPEHPAASDGARRSLSWAGTLVVAAVYVASAKLGFRMAFVAEQVTVVWPPTGIALATVLLAGRPALIGVALGAFIANSTTGEAASTAAAIATGNTLEAWVGAELLRSIGFSWTSLRVRDVLVLALGAAATSSILSASIGVTALCVAGIQPWTSFRTLWWVWWIGDAMGALVVAPLLLTLAASQPSRVKRHARPEALVLFGSVVLVSWLAFARRIGSDAEPYPVHYAVFPLVIWAALRFAQGGTAAVTAVVAGIAIWGTVNGAGVFATGSVHQRLVLLQLFMGVVAITGMLLAVAIAELRRAEHERAIEYERERLARLDADRARRDAEMARAEREQLLARADRARATAEAANLAKDRFLAQISHELRTPLSPIMAWARILRTESVDPEEAVRALETIERNASTQARLIDDLLDVARIVQGKLSLDLQPVDPVAIVRAGLETVRPSMEAKDIRVDEEFAATGHIVADGARLQQVVWNLLSNAVKFTPHAGRIGVRVGRTGGGVEIVVFDTGRGIAAEDLPRIFERFWQGEDGGQRSAGLGLGLAIARHIVEAHGGSIAADSPGPRGGTVFRVELPLRPDVRRGAAEPPMPQIREAQPSETDAWPLASTSRAPNVLAGVRVLVVDDEPDIRDVIRAVLASSGAEVRVASSAAQALAVLDGWQPTVLVSDIAMPGEDGYDLITSVRARRREQGGNVAAVALTALCAAGDRSRVLAAGFEMYVKKPVDPTELTLTVARLAEARAPVA